MNQTASLYGLALSHQFFGLKLFSLTERAKSPESTQILEMITANSTFCYVKPALTRPAVVAFWKRGYMAIHARKQEETS
jgi:hypothetical protein